MILQLQAHHVLPSSRRARKEPRALAKVSREIPSLPPEHKCLKAVSRMTMTIVPFALLFKLASASSKDLQGRGAQGAIISAISVVVSGPSRITCATTKTESVRWMFHEFKNQTDHFLWKFSQARVLYPVLWSKRVFQF